MASNIQPTGLDWKNLPDKTTPISAENLNKMANTIDDLVEAVNPLNTVEANPTGTPTEGLEKVEIDGTLYEVKGGHKILNDSGTTLTQKDNLQFKGVYTQNNGDNTEVDICRTMTKAQIEALSGESLKGFINTSDEPDSLPLTAEWVGYGSGSVKDILDKLDVDAIIQPKGGSSAITIASDTAIIDWEAGVYHINANSDTYIPERWGTLILFKSNGVYGGVIFISTNKNLYYREFHLAEKTWYYDWQQVSKKISSAILRCTGVASTTHSTGWYYADYEFTLNKTYTSGVATITGQRGVPQIAQADVSGNKLYIRIWTLSSFTSSTSFDVRVMISESTGV